MVIALAVFAALSLVDYTQTAALIRGSEGRVYEANPVASAWLEAYGWGGLAAFKVGACALFIGSVALLGRRRPRVGAVLAVVGCLTLLAVTCYSHSLLANPPQEHEEWDEDNPPSMVIVRGPATPEEVRALNASRGSGAPEPAEVPAYPSGRGPVPEPPRTAASLIPGPAGLEPSAPPPTERSPCP